MSEIKVNKLSPRTNCGTVQLGDSGDTITIPAGATITNNGTAAGFGATGAASWDTTVKTSGFTAVSGVGYFVNTTSGAITVTLPASPSAGAVVAVSDYANNFATNNLTLARNGSNIGGVADDSVLLVNGAAVTLVYVDATKGWIVTDSGNQSEASALKLYIAATGGTITCSGDYRIHTFTGPGTFTVCSVGNAAGSNTVDYMVVAGGGGGGVGIAAAASGGAGGGGAGGFREGYNPGSYTASPLATTALPVSVTGYPITVGGGGGSGAIGSNSTFSTIISAGGGDGANASNSYTAGNPGGSGGGAGAGNPGASGVQSGGAGNTPPVSPSQGFPGGDVGPASGIRHAAGGGGATVAGTTRTSNSTGGPGGAGATSSINGSLTARAGGGGGGSGNGSCGGCGAAGGGNGAKDGTAATSATANSGSGGGGSGDQETPATGGSGGSGIVIIRYKFQN
jgi:hypothetical protein